MLNVPGSSQQRTAVLDEFEARVLAGERFLLPVAAIWETGNHIADLCDGRLRRQFAIKFAKDVSKACRGDTPYYVTYFPEREEFLTWVGQFPEYALRNKQEGRPGEGISLSDLSIIKEWERTCRLHRMSRVLIWSLDGDLSSYDNGSAVSS